MKTLVALSALVGLALAAPAQFGLQGLEATESIHPSGFDSEISGPVALERSHHDFKSPVIVKKKTGYHLYRDSTEERADADPRENCGKQVRVKLCDEVAAKSTDMRRSTKNEKNEAHEEDVKNSIMMAKEAVESVQRDLKKIDHDVSEKNAQWKHGETDKNLHHDIEEVRHALLHAQNNFGNLESMNLRAATLTESDSLHNIQKEKTEEQRLAQWKRAMEIIQKNVEIARSIEDSFKFEDPQNFLDATSMTRSNIQGQNAGHKMTSFNEIATSMTSGRHTLEQTSDKKVMDSKAENHMSTEKKTEEHLENDMKSAASELSPVTHEHLHHLNLKDTQGKASDGHLSIQTQPMPLKSHNNVKPIEENNFSLVTPLRSSNNENNKMSAAEKHASADMKHKENVHKSESKNVQTLQSSHHVSALHKDQSAQMHKALESHQFENQHENIPEGKSVTKEWESSNAEKDSKHEKSAWNEAEHKDSIMKSAVHSTDNQEKVQKSLSGLEMKTSMKSAEPLTENKSHKDTEAETLDKKSGASLHSDVKMADNMGLASDIKLNGPKSLSLNKEHHNTEKLVHGKTTNFARDFETNMPIERHSHGHHGHIVPQSHYGHLEHGQHGHMHGHIHGHMHDHMYDHKGFHGHGYHGKSVEADSAMNPSVQMEIKDFSEKSALENMMQWKHHHEMARSYGGGSAYGGGINLAAAGGSGAVGVFPNAKVGGCGIPLLLSCSPSVVHGSLAKSHGYGAPAYRAEEDSKFKSKRDILKSKDKPAEKAKNITKTTKAKELDKNF